MLCAGALAPAEVARVAAEVKMDFDPDGLRCHIVIAASQILAAR